MSNQKADSSFLNHFLIFSKAQINAAAATFCDYLTLILFVELFHLSAVISVAIGAFVGAIVNFSLNRYLLFKSKSHLKYEIFKYALVSSFSLGFNSGGMWLMTDYFSMNYLVAKTIIAFSIGIFWNYPLHRYWVFTDNEKSNPSISESE